MFLPVTLDEAAKWLEHNGVSGVTGHELLRLGAYGYLRICLPLSCRAFSPLKEIANDKKRTDAGIREFDRKKVHDEAYVDLLGNFAIPPRTLFELEVKGKARIELVYGPNGELYFVHGDVSTNELRITSQELEGFAKKIVRLNAQSTVKVDAVPARTPDDMEQTLIDEKVRTSINTWDDAGLKMYSMDFLTYSKIRSGCWPVLAAHIDTPDRETLRRVRTRSEGGRRGIIRHEAIEAKGLIEACGNLSLCEHAAAVLLANASNLYLNTTTDLPRTNNSPPPIEQGEVEKLRCLTRHALEIYAEYLPKHEAAALMAAFDTAPDAAPPAAKEESKAGLSPSGDEHDNDDGDWTIKAKRIAQRLGEEQLINTGARQVTQRSICEAVAVELSKDATTHGTQGPRIANTVRTAGLRGWKFCPPKIEK